MRIHESSACQVVATVLQSDSVHIPLYICLCCQIIPTWRLEKIRKFKNPSTVLISKRSKRQTQAIICLVNWVCNASTNRWKPPKINFLLSMFAILWLSYNQPIVLKKNSNHFVLCWVFFWQISHWMSVEVKWITFWCCLCACICMWKLKR